VGILSEKRSLLTQNGHDLTIKFKENRFMYAPQLSEKNAVKVPDFAISANAKYIRVGNDLIIKAFGETHRVVDFFKSDPPPMLKTASGEIIDASQIDLAYPPMNVQVADNNDILAADVSKMIGKVSLVVEGPAKAVNGGQERPLKIGDPVYLHDVISTGSKTYLKITLKDGTVFQLGPQSKASLEVYDFDSATIGGKFESNIFTGIFRFISGAIADKNEGTHTTLKTPSATIGIRGSEIDGQVDEDGNTTILHSTGVIEVRSNYHLENITIYKPHTKIDIPNTPVENSQSEVINNDSAQHIRNFLAPLNQQPMGDGNSPHNVEQNSPATPNNVQPKTGTEGRGDVHDLPPPMPQQGFVSERDVPSVMRGKGIEPPPIDQQGFQQSRFFEESGGFPPPPPESGIKPVEQGRNINNNPQSGSKETGGKETPPPPLVEGKFTILEDHPLILPAKGTISNLKQPENGTVEIKDETLIYTPHKDFFGQDVFQLRSSELGDVKIQVNILPVEDSLIAANYKAVVLEDTFFSLKTEELLKLAYNPDMKEPLDLTKLSIVNVVSSMEFDPNLGDLTHGKLELNQDHSEIFFSPEPNFNGKVYFAYQVAQTTSDGQQLLSQPAIVEIEILSVNDLPSTDSPPFFTVKVGQPLEITEDVLLAAMRDIDADILSISRVDFPSQGSWSIVNNTSLKAIFTSDLGGQTLHFTYYVSDGSGVDVPVQATVQIEAQPIIIPPQILEAVSDVLTTPTNTALQVSTNDLLANDTIPTGTIANILAVQNPLHGTVELVNDQIKFMPDKDFKGLASFEYVIEDDAGHQDIGTVEINVQLTGHFIQLPQASTALQYTVNFPPINVDNQAFISNMAFAPAGETRYLRIQASGLSTSEQLTISNNGAATVLTATPNLIVLSFDGAVGQSALENLIKSVSYNAFIGTTMPTAGTKTISFSLFDNQAAAESGSGAIDSVSRSINLTLPQIAADDVIEVAVNTPFLIPADQLFANDSGIGLKIIGLSNLSNGVQAQLYGNDVAVYVDSNAVESALGFDYQVQTLSGATGSAHVTLQPNNIQIGTPADDILNGISNQNNILYGLDGNDTLTGSAGNDVIDGGAGDDTIDGGNGFDQLIGGLGNDTFLFNPNNGIANISGGDGEDVLKLNTSGAYLDLIANQSAPAGQNLQLSGIDRIDVGAGNTLVLNANDVLSISDHGQLIVDGGAGSSVISAGQGWTNAGLIALGGVNYTDYSMGSAHLLINQNISTQFIF
jgi:Ca2+-binding RTX toxin-like protein